MHIRRRSYAKTWTERLTPVRDYLRDSDLHGYKYLAEPNRILLERIIWLIILMVFFFGTVYAISSAAINYYNAPTAISEVLGKHSVKDIPFPGVCVCVANRFSKKKLTNLTNFIIQHQNETSTTVGSTWEEVFEATKSFIHLLDYSTPPDETVIIKLHTMMITYFNGTYPIDDIIKNLQPPCSDILLYCKWLNVEINCTSRFQFRRTAAGTCCIFNYIRPFAEEFTDATVQYINTSEPLRADSNNTLDLNGLTIIIDTTPDDDVISLTNTMDTRVQVINPKDFPDVMNGALREAYVKTGSETFIQLSPRYIRANPELASIPLANRGCAFEGEIVIIFKNYYTYGECYFACRLKDVIKMCGCLPVTMPQIYNASYCDLADLQCLIRWKDKWMNTDPPAELVTKGNPLCPECYPTCDYYRYELATSYDLIKSGATHPFKSLLTDKEININASRNSIIHIYYAQKYVNEFEQSMISTWFELLSNFGGILSIAMGGSLISIIEVLYHLSGYFGAYYFRLREQKKEKKRQRRISNISSVSDSLPPYTQPPTITFTN